MVALALILFGRATFVDSPVSYRVKKSMRYLNLNVTARNEILSSLEQRLQGTNLLGQVPQCRSFETGVCQANHVITL